MKLVLVSLLTIILFTATVASHEILAKSAKDSKARRDIDRAIGRSVEGAFSKVKTVNISTYAVPNEVNTVYNKTSSGSLPPIIVPPEPQVCNKNEHLENNVCVPDSTTTAPAAGDNVCMVGDFKDSKVFDAMAAHGCNYRVALGDNGYSSSLELLKSIAPDRCQIGNHDSPENGNDKIYQEALAYCGNSWWVKFGTQTVMLGFNTQGDTTKQLNAAKNLLADQNFIQGVKNVIFLSHKGGHVFPNSHHPAEAKDFYAGLEKAVPTGIRVYETAGHDHNAASADSKNWYISGNGGRSFYQCGVDNFWTFCNNKTLAYLQFNIDDNATITAHFIDTSGKIIH